MLDKSKIRLMARLAIYDKEYGAIDRRKNNYYKWDYVYFRNFWTRLGVFFGCMIIALFYVLNKILVEQADVFALDLKQEATKLGFFTVLALVLYTFIGTLVANNEYKKSKARLNAYYTMLGMLEGRDEQKDEPSDDRGAGTDAGYEELERESEWEQDFDGQEEAHEPPARLNPEWMNFKQPEPNPPEIRRTFSKQETYSEPNGFADAGEKGIDILKRLRGVKGDGDTGAPDLRESDDYNDV